MLSVAFMRANAQILFHQQYTGVSLSGHAAAWYTIRYRAVLGPYREI